jgi:hypothetical protein
MGSLRGPVEFFLRYGLSKRAVASSYEPLWGLREAGSLDPEPLLVGWSGDATTA